MEKWVSFLQSHSEVLTEAAIIVLGLLLAVILLRILRQIKRLNRSLLSITKNVQAYFDVIMQEEVPGQDKPQASEEQAQQQSKCSDGAETSAEQERRKQEEEEVFNAVLQEYFS